MQMKLETSLRGSPVCLLSSGRMLWLDGEQRGRRQTEMEREHSCRRGIHLSLDDDGDDDDEQLQLRFELEPNSPTNLSVCLFKVVSLCSH